MRFMSVTVPLLISAALPQVQPPSITTLAPAITVTTTRPRVDVATTFKLVGSTTGGLWDFGDGTAPQNGGATMSHVYRSADAFTVKVTAGRTTHHQTVTIVEPRRIVSTPSVLVPGKAAVLSLEEPLGASQVWTIGENGRPISGGASLSHTFLREGTYTVSVKDGADLAREFKASIAVGLQGPGAPFSISYLALRWEDGTSERSVRQGETGLVAYADLKFEGTGQLQAEWLVDGQSQHALSQQLGFAKLTTLQSGRAVPRPATGNTPFSGSGSHTLASTIAGEFQVELPTNVAGEHRVTLKVLQPRLAFPVPVLRYFVKLAGEAQGPVIHSISPASATPGQEVELILTGSGFTEDMALNLGKDVAALDKPQILSPGKALVKVFVSRSALPGTRNLQARKAGGSPSAPAKLEILLAGTAPAGAATRLDSAKVASLARTGDRTKAPLSTFTQVPAGFRSPAVDLAKAPRLSFATSRLVNVSGGTGFGMIQDSNARVRQEKVPVCSDGQRLDLSKVVLSAPSYSLIGVNTSGEFQSDDLPVLRDTTQFTWQEKNPGTSEYFELQFFTARAGAPLKTVKIPGNSHSFDVSPAFVQELSRLYAATDVYSAAHAGTTTTQVNKTATGAAPNAKGSTGAVAHGSTVLNLSGSAGAKANNPQSMVNLSGSSTAKNPAPKAATGTGAAVNTGQNLGLSLATGTPQEPDLVIPGPMQKKAQVVWRVLGFRSYPCLVGGGAADEKKAVNAQPAAAGKALDLDRKVMTTTLSVPSAHPSTQPSAQSAPKRATTTLQNPPAASASARSLDTSLSRDRHAVVPAQPASAARLYKTVATEVSRSEVWPLRIPAAPQGLNPNGCTGSQNDPKVVLIPNRGGTSGGWMSINTGFLGASGSGSQPQNSKDENTYVFDEVWFYGTFDLSAQRMPYRLLPASVLPKGTTAAGAALQGVADAAKAIADAANNAMNSANPFGSSSGSTSGGSAGGQGQPMLVKAVGLVTFKNVFVDWGDGTIEPFSGTPVDTLYTAANGNYTGTDFYSNYTVAPGAFKHTYTRGAIDPPYRVRVFVLSEEDMRQRAMVGEVTQALTPVQSSKGLFTRLSGMAQSGYAKPVNATLNLGGVAPKAAAASTGPQGKSVMPANQVSNALLGGPPSGNQALGRAYVVFCHDFRVVEREDPCANAPLNLVAVTLEFPKSDSPAARTHEATTVATLSGAATAKAPDLSGPASGKAVEPKALVNLSGSASAKAVESKPVVNLSGSTSAKAHDAQTVVNVSGASARKVAVTAPAGPNPPSTSGCNLFYSVKTKVSYYGHGTVRVVWMVDGHRVGSSDFIGKSPKRTGLKASECLACPNPVPTNALGEEVLNSPALPVDSLGRHSVAVTADVLPDKSGDADFIAIAAELQGLAAFPAVKPAGSTIPRRSGSTLSPRTVHTLKAAFGQASGGKPPVHLGLLNPSQTPGQPAFLPLNQVAGMAGLQTALAGTLEPPLHVVAGGVYEVKAAQPGQLCNLFFPTKGGKFPITNLGSTLKLTPDGTLSKASGKGLLVFGVKSATASDAVRAYPLDLSFSNWKVDETTVVQGQIDLTPNRPYDGPGVSGSLLEVHGAIADKNTLQDLRVKMKLSPIDTSIVTGDGTVRPEWTAEAPITTHGDWIATKGLDGLPLSLAASKLGPTPWFFSAEGVTIDLSGTEGTDPNGGSSPEWVGVKLGTVTVVPATLGIQTGSWTNLPKPKNWTIEGLGVKGQMDTGAWQVNYRQGHLAIANIHFKGTKEGHYSATYKDLEIRSPWFKNPIKGDASWLQQNGAGNYALNLDKIQADKLPTLAGGPLSLDLQHLQFVPLSEQNGGLLLQGKARITLKAEDKPLAAFDVDRVGFGLDGLLYFGNDGQRSATVTLNASSTLGPTPADLQTAVLTGGSAPDTPLDLLVNAKLRLSANPVIPGTPVGMHYSLKASGSPGVFTAPEVKVDPFSMNVAFPLGSPSMKANIATNYQPGGTAGGAPAMPSNRFSGSVDLSMFGGTPVKAQFVLGYDQGKDYFATRVDVPVGPSGIVIYPEIVSLFRLSGGFAYNFGPEAFTDGGTITNAKPDFKGNTLFMAGARLGSADGFAYTLDGQLVIASTGLARLDLGAWLLASNPSGNAPLRGYLEYANGNFDGRLWGGFHFLADNVSLDLGASKEAAACSLHFGGGSWHVYAGNRDGQRIVGKLFGNSTEAYLMLGNDVGLAVGGRQTWYFGAGVGVQAYAKGWMDMGLQITPQPKIIGDFSAGMEAGICLSKVGCVSAGVNAHIHAEALPVSVSAHCCIDLPWPFSEACFTVKM
jgi:hypothetical protein